MIALTVVLGFVALGLFLFGFYRAATEDEGVGAVALGTLVGIAWIVLFLMVSNAKFSDDTFTGYIYSKDSFAGVTNYHIRFSENAGTDSQPSFCVNDDARDKKKLDELVGSGKKVTVSIPAVGWYFSDDIWHCASNAQLKG